MRQLGLVLLASVVFVGTAFATDLPQRVYTKAPVRALPVAYNWTGFYIGGNIGGSWGSQENALVSTAGVTQQTSTAHPNGVISGVQAGYNWQVNQIVFGIEADIQGSSQKGSGSFNIPGGGIILVIPPTTVAYTDRLNWFGTVRGRLGWAHDRWLPYLTGGWAYGHGYIDGTVSFGPIGSFNVSHSYSGWTLGGGLEWAFMNRWSAKIEYLYIDFGNGPTVPVTPTLNIVSGKMTDNIVRGGINYRF